MVIQKAIKKQIGFCCACLIALFFMLLCEPFSVFAYSNVAEGKPIISNSYVAPYEASRVVDGKQNYTSRWYATSPVDTHFTLQIDLQEVYQLTMWGLIGIGSDYLQQDLNPKAYYMEISENGMDWTKVSEEFNNGDATPRYSLASPTARYVRLVITQGNGNNSKWTSVNEIIIWGHLQQYALTFETNGGSFVYGQHVEKNAFATEPNPPTKEGYTFAGWYKEATFTNAWDFAKDVVTEATTLYANWEVNQYDLTFDSNGGGTVAPQSVTYHTAAKEPTSPTKPGHTFAGWYKEATFTTAWDFAEDVVTEATTLYAKWEVNQYDLTFDSTGGSTIAPQSVTYNTAAKEPTSPTKPGHIFAGWYKEATFTTAWDFAKDVVTEATTLYANWEVNQYDLTFDSNGGGTVAPQSVTYNTTAKEPTSPTKPGYTFTGWYKEATFTTAWDFAEDVVTEATTLYAKWEANQYDLTFDSNGGSTVAPQSVTYHTAAKEPTSPTKPGYTFTGWYKEATFTNAWDFAKDVVTEATTLYANWEVNQYDLTFDSNGGSTVAAQSVTYNTAAKEPTSPTKPGHTFTGWYKEATFTTAWDFAEDVVTVDTVLYAKWEANQYDLTFDSNGGSIVAPQSVTYHTTAKEPISPTKPGYTFTGWYKEATFTNAWDFASDVVNEATILYAKWKVNSSSGNPGMPTPSPGPTPEPSPEPTPQLPVPFTDTDNHWAKEYIQQAVAAGIFKGYPDGTFKPNQSLTRAQVVSILVRALELQATQPVHFTDILGYAEETKAEIAAAYQFGFVKGYGDQFNPSAPITRTQLALMLKRAYELKMGQPFVATQPVPFVDIAHLDEETKTAIALLYAFGIVEGSEGKFMPGNPTTRAQAAKIVVHYAHLMEGETSVNP